MGDAAPAGAAGGQTEQSVREAVRALIRELAPQPESIGQAHDRLVDDLGFHSLALLELAFTLEDEFDLPPIDESTAREITTVTEVEDHVVENLTERGELTGPS